MLDEQFVKTFFSSFYLCLGYKNSMEENFTQQWICLFMEKRWYKFYLGRGLNSYMIVYLGCFPQYQISVEKVASVHHYTF